MGEFSFEASCSSKRAAVAWQLLFVFNVFFA